MCSFHSPPIFHAQRTQSVSPFYDTFIERKSSNFLEARISREINYSFQINCIIFEKYDGRRKIKYSKIQRVKKFKNKKISRFKIIFQLFKVSTATNKKLLQNFFFKVKLLVNLEALIV